MKKTILIMVATTAIICVVVLIFSGYIGQKEKIPNKEDLVLSNYPKLFERDVVIVIGENASQMEYEGAEVIAENLHNIAGNMPAIKSDTELTENDKVNCNLILVGRPNVNRALEEVYEVTDATRVTSEYPGAGKGMLEILKNPWNEDKALLVAAGSDEWGTKVAEDSLLGSAKIESEKGSFIILSPWNKTEMTEVVALTKQCLVYNNIEIFTFKSAEKINFIIEGPGKVILVKSFPTLPLYINKTVWEVRWKGELEELEYVVIVDPESKDIVCAWSINRLAAPGITPLEIKNKKEVK